jgi:PAS domain S-box-containing protein
VRSGRNDIIGAVVIKIGSDSLEPSFRQYRLCFLTDPHGIIFLTSQPEMLYKSLQPLDEETRQALAESRQFGSSTFQPIGLQVSPGGTDLVYKGNYYLQNSSIINSEGWSAVLLTPTGEVRAAWLPGLMILLFLSALINIFFLVMHQSIEDTALISASEENYRSVFNGVNEAIFVHEFPSGKIVDINQKACEMQGLPRENLLTAQLDEAFNISPHTAEKALLLLEKAAAGTQQLFEWRLKNSAGKPLWVEVNLKKAVLGNEERVLAVVRDINSRKQAEEALKESEDKYRTIFETTGAGTFIIGEDTTIELVNREFERLSGYTKTEVENKKSWTEFVAAEDLEMMKRYHRLRRIDQGSAPRDYEFRFIDVYGNMKYIYLSINMFPGTKKSVASLVDITERKRVERLLEEQTVFLQRLLDTIPYPVYYKNTDRFYQGCNKAFEVFAGRAKDEIIGKTVYDLFPADQASYFTSRDDELFREPGAQVYETTVTYPDGIKHDAIYNRITYANNDGSIAGLLGVIIDITERKRWQEEMARLERLNLIGEMAAGIGHEIRNPMTTVRGLLQLLRARDEIVQHREYYDIMIEELDRANTIISEFLSLAKNKPLSKRMLNLSSIVETMFPLIHADAMQSGMFVQIEMGEIPDLLLDEKEMRQLILNLVRNGLEAMQPGGKITIETASEGQSVVLKVRDEGKGIDKDVLEKLGTPFYTTKDSGTGLGLAVCYSIATRHNAEIRIETSPAGTTFYITFTPV